MMEWSNYDQHYFDYFDTERVWKQESNQETYYFFPDYEEEESTVTSSLTRIKYYFANGQRLARRTVDNTADLAAGTPYTLTLTPGFSGGSYIECWRVWIDYNHDGDFLDAGEQVYQGISASTITTTMTVPTSAIDGPTRMRVAMRYDTYPASTGSFTYGEVEDYSVLIAGGTLFAMLPTTGYPAAQGTNTGYEYIDRVGLAAIDADSGNNNGYKDFTGGAVNYHHTDHLGSSTRITDAVGSQIRSQGYDPYGTDSYSTGTAFIKHKFTGQEQDDSGIYFYGSRYYDSVLGRFLQPDSIVPYPDDPQSYNRYSYARNNPVLYVDPSGHIFWVPVIVAIAKGAAIGAALGAAHAAVTGGDIGEGALHGAIGGAFGGAGGAIFKSAAGAIAGAAAGGAISASISGGDPLMGALSAGIGAGIGHAFAGYIPTENLGVVRALKGFGISGFSGAISGGISAELQGGDFWDGATNGAIGAVVTYAVAVDLPDAIARNVLGDDPQHHLFAALIFKALDVIAVGHTVTEAISGEITWSDAGKSIAGDIVNPTPKVAKLAVKGAGKLLAATTKGPLAKIEKQLAEHGLKSVGKSLRNLEKRLAEHRRDLELYKAQGGFTSSVEREIRAFEGEIQAIKELLGRKK